MQKISSNDWLAYTYCYSAQALFTFTNIFAIEHNFTSFEINTMRGICVIIFTYFYAKKESIDLYYVVQNSFGILVCRNFMILSWVVVNVGSFYYLSFSVIYSINIVGSLSVFLWDYFIYQVTINRHQIIGVLLGLAGSLLMINCNYFMSLIDENFEIKTDFEFFKSTEVFQTVIAGLVLLISTFGMGLGFSWTKSLKFHKNSTESNMLFGVTILFVSGIGVSMD